MEEEYSYWEIWYVSCEGNERWTTARAPFDWDSYDVESAISMGGCGDEPARITSVEEICECDFSWDFVE